MPEDQSIVVTPSVESGNASLETEPTTPSADPTPAADPAPVTPTEPEELFELPDGRKVDAGTLSKEWKENFYPEYTRKSQELAQARTVTPPITTEPAKEPLEEWQPQSYAEIVQKAKEEMRADMIREQQEVQEQKTAVESAVVAQLTEVKTIDPQVNENALFQHALKYKFSDLRVAHQNMKDMSEMAKAVKQTTAKEIAKRSDPVSVTPGATGAKPNPASFNSARDFVRSLKE